MSTLKWLILVVMLMTVTMGCLIFIGAEPPIEVMSMAREEITSSKSKLVSDYSKAELKMAMASYDSAMRHWNLQNQKLKYFRDYALTTVWAEKSIAAAKNARTDARKKSKVHANELEIKFELANKKINRYESIFKNFPKTDQQLQNSSRASMLYNEASIAFGNKNMHDAENKITDCLAIIGKLLLESENSLKEYFNSNSDDWNNLEKNAIEISKKRNQFSILVDKYSRKCYLLKGGKIHKEYTIELGKNWIGDKMHAGDKKTPEGQYKILKKKSNGSTKYHKALLINYPNSEDKERFQRNKQDDKIPKNKTIGNLIEIHGDGGKGIDWTDGCIALTNQDMDDLFKWVSEDTPVMIVGSLLTIDQILK